MLSDEEKEAIEYIKNCLDNEYNFKNATRQKDKKAYNIILNLIEKQSKEIEELNYIKRCFDYCVEQENKKWDDKIKAKIEELDKEEEDLQNSISDEEREEYSDGN